MSEMFAARNVDAKTKEFIYDYAHDHNLNVGETLHEMAVIVQRYLKEHKKEHKKKYVSFFEIYDKVAFESTDPNLSKNIDKYLYGKRD